MSEEGSLQSTPRRDDRRQQWTLKGKDFGPELRNLVKKAAERQGMAVNAWVASVLRERAQAVIKGESTPQSTPPVIMTERLDTQDRRIEELAAAVHALMEEQRKGFWRRILGR